MVLPVFLLSACLGGGGGGSFDLDSVDTEAPRPAPKYQDVSSEKPQAQKDQGGYGFAMRLKRRNWYPQAKEDEVKLNESDWEATGLPTEPKKLPKRQKSVIDKVETDSDSNIYSSPYLTQSNHQNGNTGNGTNLPKNEVTDYKDFKYVYSGWFYKHAKNEIIRENSSIKGAKNGDDGYIFYHGKEPSRQLPASGTVTYKGVWHFATDVKKSQNFRDIIQPSKKQGDRYSGFSGDDGEEYSNKNEATLQSGHEGYGFTSNLEVDFNNKKLTGKLIRNNANTGNNQVTTQYYSLEAQVTGNRFNGKATATDKPGNGETKQHPFVSDSSSLSGGFFGPKGEELGFRFLSDDKKVAVVGSAKTKDNTANGNTAAASGGAGAAASGGAAAMPSENSKLTTVLDAVELTHGGTAIKNLDNFSNAAQLVVDGIMIPLLPKDSESGNNQANQGTNGGTAFTYKTTYTPTSDEKDAQAGTAENGDQAASNTAGDTNGKTKTYEVEVCCSNLNYLKYGLLTRKTAGNTGEGGNGSQTTAAQTAQGAQSMFLQGERTPVSDMAARTEANAKYRGTWYGHIANDTSWSGNASDKEGGNKADFTVNFGEKKITGTLTAENRQAATFTIEGDIEDNGFSGTAKTADSGFDLDQSNTTRTPKAYITNAKVQGGFYGPKAEELGGWFAYPGDKQAQPPASGSGASAANSATVVFGAKRQQLVQ